MAPQLTRVRRDSEGVADCCVTYKSSSSLNSEDKSLRPLWQMSDRKTSRLMKGSFGVIHFKKCWYKSRSCHTSSSKRDSLCSGIAAEGKVHVCHLARPKMSLPPKHKHPCSCIGEAVQACARTAPSLYYATTTPELQMLNMIQCKAFFVRLARWWSLFFPCKVTECIKRAFWIVVITWQSFSSSQLNSPPHMGLPSKINEMQILLDLGLLCTHHPL